MDIDTHTELETKAAIPLDAGYAWRDDARHRGLKVKLPQRRHADSSTSGIIGGAGSR